LRARRHIELKRGVVKEEAGFKIAGAVENVIGISYEDFDVLRADTCDDRLYPYP
jgi:hypothetical protein